MEARVSVLEAGQDHMEKILESMDDNIKALTAIASNVSHIANRLDDTIESITQYGTEMAGMSRRLDDSISLLKIAVGEHDKRINNVVRIIYVIGASVGTGLAVGVARLCWVFIDFISPHH